MKPATGIVLTAAALALLATGGWWRRSVSVPAGEATRAASPVEIAAPPAASVPPASPEATQALRIAQLLTETRQAPELAASRRREAQEGAALLRGVLQARPEAWGDVYDLLCCLDDADLAVRVAALLGAAVDAGLERRLVETVRTGSNAQARRVALVLLEGRRTSDSFVAIQAAAGDTDPRIRLAALEGLGARRSEDPGTVNAILAKRVQVEPDPVLRDAARSLLGEQVPPRGPAPVARKAPLSGALRISAKR